MKHFLSLSTIIIWMIFIFIDIQFDSVITTAVSEKQGTYGELYGPLSFFQPAVFWLAIILTAWLAIYNLKKN